MDSLCDGCQLTITWMSIRMSTIKLNTDCICLGHLASNARSLQENSQSEGASYCRNIIRFFFFQACERAESSKSCYLIGPEGRRYFTILPANPGGIVGSFIQKLLCCLWMSKNRHFQTIFLLKLALLLALAREKWISLFRHKNLKGESSKSARKTAKVKQNRWLVMSLH